MKTSKKAIENLQDQAVDTNKVQGGDSNKLANPMLNPTMQGEEGIGSSVRRQDFRPQPTGKLDMIEEHKAISKRK